MRVAACVNRHSAGTIGRASLSHTKPETKPKGFWGKSSTRREFFDRAAEALNVKHPVDWGRVSHQSLFRLGGKGLMKRYGYCLSAALQDVYPEEDINPMEWRRKPRNYWGTLENRRAFLDMLAKRKGVECVGDWRRVSTSDVRDAGGTGLLSYYGSFVDALKDSYEEHREHWSESDASTWRNKSPNGHWEEEGNVCAFMERAKQHLLIREDSDWQRVSTVQLQALPGGRTVLEKMSLVDALTTAFPGKDWKKRLGSTTGHKRAAQRLMKAHISLLLSHGTAFPSSLPASLATEDSVVS